MRARKYTPGDDNRISGALRRGFRRGRPSPAGEETPTPTPAELAAEDARARAAMGDSPYPAGDEDEV